LLISSTVAVIATAYLSTLGEELGWRGFLLQRLIQAGIPAPLFITGLIWAAYHWPLILAGVYSPGGRSANKFLSIAVFTILVIAVSYLFSWLRLWSGSVWPACLAHGLWNNIMQVAFDPSTTGQGSRFWVGESGVLVAAVAVALVALLSRTAIARQRRMQPQ
jgi:uncharacterized protein